MDNLDKLYNVQLDLRPDCLKRVPSLPAGLRYVVFFAWALMGVCTLVIGYNAAMIVRSKGQLQETGVQEQVFKDKLSRASAIRGQLKDEELKAQRMISWLDCNYSSSKVLQAMFKESNKDVRFDRLHLSLTQGQPQLHVRIDLNGSNEALEAQCQSLNSCFSELKFRSISVNQPWSPKGISFEGLYILPKKGQKS